MNPSSPSRSELSGDELDARLKEYGIKPEWHQRGRSIAARILGYEWQSAGDRRATLVADIAFAMKEAVESFRSETLPKGASNSLLGTQPGKPAASGQQHSNEAPTSSSSDKLHQAVRMLERSTLQVHQLSGDARARVIRREEAEAILREVLCAQSAALRSEPVAECPECLIRFDPRWRELAEASGQSTPSHEGTRRCRKCGGCETPGMPGSCDCAEPQFVTPSATLSTEAAACKVAADLLRNEIVRLDKPKAMFPQEAEKIGRRQAAFQEAVRYLDPSESRSKA